MQAIRLEPVFTPLVNKFYQTHKVRGRANKQDQIWVVKNTNIVAACRIQSRNGELFLSTLFTSPVVRNQGLAKRLVYSAVSSQAKSVYTFAYRNLVEFYFNLGFQEVACLPDELSAMYRAYKNQNRDIVALYCVKE